MRLKENADDYRYFPDPDLVPLVIPEARIEAVRRGLPELADARGARVRQEYGLDERDARVLTESRALADFSEAAFRAGADPREAARWILRDVLRALRDAGTEIEQARLEPAALAGLLALVADGRTTAQAARGLLPELVERGGDPAELVRARGLETVSDTGLLAAAVDAVLREHPAEVERLRGGEEKVLNFLMGQVMKRTGGKADPAAVRALIAQRAGAGGRP
jgi:aspartyl-tRNA(Asn)/glutamyl-tRNA(Gln) amidotransferase subunit B